MWGYLCIHSILSEVIEHAQDSVLYHHIPTNSQYIPNIFPLNIPHESQHSHAVSYCINMMIPITTKNYPMPKAIRKKKGQVYYSLYTSYNHILLLLLQLRHLNTTVIPETMTLLCIPCW